MKIDIARPVSVLIIGAGGTGGYIIPHLYRIAYATKRKYRIVIADGDIVEKKNLISISVKPRKSLRTLLYLPVCYILPPYYFHNSNLAVATIYYLLL